jgi:hypothetical protein
MIASSVLAFTVATLGIGPLPTRDVTQPPPYDQFLIVPLRIHILTAPDLDLADCKLRDADITRIARKLNTIWSKAGILFGVESIVRESAVQRDRFRLVAELDEGQIGIEHFLLLLPKQSRVSDGLHAFFFHELPFNGAYLGEDSVIVQEGAQLNEVEGGIDEPIPRVLGNTLGRALGLRHRPGPRTSLLASGTTGIILEPAEVARAQRVARTITGVMSVAAARGAAEAAQAAGQVDQARRLRLWLAEVPGAPSTAAKR